LRSGDPGKEAQGVKLLDRFARDGSYEANYTLGDFYLRWKSDSEKALEYFQAIAPGSELAPPEKPLAVYGGRWAALEARAEEGIEQLSEVP
jgi:TPR repeat protein